MAVRIVQVGSPRTPDEGVRIGTVRYVPRGVRKEEWAERDFFDVWLPELAPSARLIQWWKRAAEDPSWATFAERYRTEMDREGRHLIPLLAAMSRAGNFSVGCYCEDEELCHRSVLRELLEEQGADVV